MFEVGQIVISKAGRDKQSAFIVVDVKDEFIYLVDGKLRKVENPKRKNKKHVQKTNTVNQEIKKSIENKEYLNNAYFRKAIESFLRK